MEVIQGTRLPDQYLVGTAIVGGGYSCHVCGDKFCGEALRYRLPGNEYAYACTDKFACQVRSGRREILDRDPVMQYQAEQEIAIAEGTTPEGWIRCAKETCAKPFKTSHFRQIYCSAECRPSIEKQKVAKKAWNAKRAALKAAKASSSDAEE
jgi:hypothetical protein